MHCVDFLINFFWCSVFKVTSIVNSKLFLNEGHFVLKLAVATLG